MNKFNPQALDAMTYTGFSPERVQSAEQKYFQYTRLLDEGILEEKDGLLINKSCNQINYFTILKDIPQYTNYWTNCIDEYLVKEDDPVAKDAVNVFKDEMKNVIFDSVYSVYFNNGLYIVARTREQLLKYFKENNLRTIKFMYWEYDCYFSDCVVYDRFTQMYFIVFKIVNVPEEERMNRLIKLNERGED